ncbi:MAG: efflux RND transporter periplasmic adaptor subunit [Candidatus Aminicenantes bacterium]|nr:efflux RND transporter periplasmic adaptor subunit [Candidatus Aminicenantes bacterium]
MKKKLIFGIIIIVVIAGIVLGFTLFRQKNGKQEKYKKEAVDKGNIEAVVITSGTLNPVTIVDVGSQVSGRISSIYVDFNSEVKAGQLIAELDPSQFLTKVKQNEANYESAKASVEKSKVTLDNSKKKLDRALELFEKDLISYEEKETAETAYYSAVADLQSSEARLQQADSQLESSKVDLEYTIIKSPIDGVVINRNINVGQTVAASFQAPVLFQIANDLSKMQVECSIDEADIGRIKQDQKVRFTVDAFPDDSFEGTVIQVRYSPEIVSNVVTYTTIVNVENPEIKLRPGMTATVSIVTGEAKNVLRVPNAALRFTPTLGPEQMREILTKMREERTAQQQASGQTSPRRSEPRQGSENRRPPQEGQQGSSDFLARFLQRANQKGSGIVWMENEKGELRPVFIRTGVTDNTYTEVVRARGLEEGQLVITGMNGSESSSNDSRGFRGGFMMRR